MAQLKVGIVGTGWVSGEYIKAFGHNPGTVVTALCGTSAAKAAAKATEYGLSHAQAFGDYDAFLAQSVVDIVVIATPNHLHADQAVKAAAAGKHIVLEKPVATTWDDMKRVRDAVRRNGVKSIVGFVLRWNELLQTAKALVADGTIGELFYAEVDYMHAITPDYSCYEWSRHADTGGSILQVGGCHAVDGLRWLLRAAPTEVVALSSRVREDFEQDTTIVLLVKYENGALAKVCGSYDNVSPYIYNLKLFGRNGTLVNDELCSTRSVPPQEGWQKLAVERPDSGDVATHPFQQEVDHFVDVLLLDEPCVIDIDEAMKTFELIEAADRSAARGGSPVRLPLQD